MWKAIAKRLSGAPAIFALYPDRACLWRRNRWIDGISLEKAELFLRMIEVAPGGGEDNGVFRQVNVWLTPHDEELLSVAGITPAQPTRADRIVAPRPEPSHTSHKGTTLLR